MYDIDIKGLHSWYIYIYVYMYVYIYNSMYMYVYIYIIASYMLRRFQLSTSSFQACHS